MEIKAFHLHKKMSHSLKKALLFFPLYSKESQKEKKKKKGSMPEVSEALRLNLHLSVPGPVCCDAHLLPEEQGRREGWALSPNRLLSIFC